MTQLRSSAPVWPVSDVGATVQWFEQNLGFESSTHPQAEPFEWASLVRGNVEIMLQRVIGYEKPNLYTRREGGVWDLYIRVQGSRELYEGLRAQVSVISPLTHREYGCEEFEVVEPNGYVLVFGECS